MSGLDIEGVLAGHRVNYHHRNVGGETAATLRYTSCDGCDWLGGWHDEAGWEAHVAAVLREQIAAAQAEAYEWGRADERRHAAALSDYRHWSNISAGPPADPPNPYRAARVAPSRVPGEETP